MHLGDRLYEVRYEDVVGQPEMVLREIAEFAGIDASRDWMSRAIAQIEAPRRTKPEVPKLPEEMGRAFAEYRIKYGNCERVSDAEAA